MTDAEAALTAQVRLLSADVKRWGRLHEEQAAVVQLLMAEVKSLRGMLCSLAGGDADDDLGAHVRSLEPDDWCGIIAVRLEDGKEQGR